VCARSARGTALILVGESRRDFRLQRKYPCDLANHTVFVDHRRAVLNALLRTLADHDFLAVKREIAGVVLDFDGGWFCVTARDFELEQRAKKMRGSRRLSCDASPAFTDKSRVLLLQLGVFQARRGLRWVTARRSAAPMKISRGTSAGALAADTKPAPRHAA